MKADGCGLVLKWQFYCECKNAANTVLNLEENSGMFSCRLSEHGGTLYSCCYH